MKREKPILRRNYFLAILFSLVTLLTFGVNSRISAEAAPTQTPTLGQLKVCKVAGPGVTRGTLFTITVSGTPYSVPAGKPGFCVLAGQFPLNTNITVQEVIPADYFVSSIQVKPRNRTVSKNIAIGNVVVTIGAGVTEVIYTNAVADAPVTQTNAVPGPPKEERGGAERGEGQGRLEICKEADGSGVSGNFTFLFAGRSRTIPVGTCTMTISVPPGPLTITEVARSGYVLTDIYTIPADRLISENLSARSATVTIVQGPSSSQTIVVFRNRAESS